MEFQLIRSRRGVFLLEAVIAVAIVAIAMSGLAFALHRCADASLTLGKDGQLRVALASRLAELRVENLSIGSNALSSGSIIIQQNVRFADVRSSDREPLPGLYEIHLKASFSHDTWPPLEVSRLMYRP